MSHYALQAKLSTPKIFNKFRPSISLQSAKWLIVFERRTLSHRCFLNCFVNIVIRDKVKNEMQYNKHNITKLRYSRTRLFFLWQILATRSRILKILIVIHLACTWHYSRPNICLQKLCGYTAWWDISVLTTLRISWVA